MFSVLAAAHVVLAMQRMSPGRVDEVFDAGWKFHRVRGDVGLVLMCLLLRRRSARLADSLAGLLAGLLAGMPLRRCGQATHG